MLSPVCAKGSAYDELVTEMVHRGMLQNLEAQK